MRKEIGLTELMLGICYYPEHWPRGIWRNDLARMEELGIRRIRVAEFAWTLMEPAEGEYDFSLFDAFLDEVNKTTIKVILGTPTATPPAWITQKYPEVLNATAEGVLYRHGMRRHYNYTSSKYCELTEKIVTQMAKRYGYHPAVCGWQVDNELNCEVDEFYAESDHAAFREYLKNKYKTLETLNRAWGTNFWSQIYMDWSEIYLRRHTIHDSSNPHLALDSKRFISDVCIRYCRLQSDLLRHYIDPSQFITTNGTFEHVDYPRMVDECLDYLCYDSYPAFGLSSRVDDALKDRLWSWNLSKVRAVCPVFGVMEQQSGAGGWVCRMTLPTPKPGQMRLWTYQSIAHGADYISYYRWRTCSYGTEIYWHGLYNYDNEPNRRVEELARISGEIGKLAELAGAHYRAEWALVSDYDNDWDGEMDIWHGPMRRQSERNFFAASTLLHSPMDCLILKPDTTLVDLCQYKALVYPHPTIVTEETATLLRAYVEKGGKLLVGARTGYKDINGQCPMRPMPGPLAELCGVKVVDFTKVVADNADIRIAFRGEQEPVEFLDVLETTTPDASVLGIYANDFCVGKTAAAVHPVGKGATYSYGSGFSEAVARQWLGQLGVEAPLADTLEVPAFCEVALRSQGERDYLFVLNYNAACAPVMLRRPMRNLLTGETLSGIQTLEGYGVMVLTPSDDR